MDNAINVNCIFDVTSYIVAVEEMAKEYFDDNGDYTPHFGFLNVMRIFYNMCVKTDLYELPHEIVDAMDMDKLVTDEDFVEEFNKALVGDGQFRFDFSNAFAQAMDIVRTRNTSPRETLNALLTKAIAGLQDIGDIFTAENIDKIAKIAEDIKDGNLNAEQLAAAYGKSERFQDVVKDSKEDA